MNTILAAPNVTSPVSRRKFLFLGGAAFAAGVMSFPRSLQAAPAAAVTPDVQAKVDGVFQPEPLPYAYEALQPSIDTETMHLHHDKHYVAYTTNLNKALEQVPELKSKSIEDLLSSIKSLPEPVRKAIRNNGGGYYNHGLFWKMMAPKGTTKASDALTEAITKKFGGMDKFQEQFNKEAASVFGSGWAWLVMTEGDLVITSTPNQDSPIMADTAEVPGKIVLGLDVWEHSYYLKYKNVRADYIKSWWDVVNWKTASDLYAKATT